jgi:transcription antitermination factor NusG
MSKTVEAFCPASGKIIFTRRRRRRTATRETSSAAQATGAWRPTTAAPAAGSTSVGVPVAAMDGPGRRGVNVNENAKSCQGGQLTTKTTDAKIHLSQLKAGRVVTRRAVGASAPIPVSPLEDDPPALPPNVSGIDEIAGRFFVAHVKSRMEKVFAWACHAQGIPYYLPMEEVVSVSGRLRRVVKRPLFGGFVFVGGDDEDGTVRGRVFGMPGNRVCRTLNVVDQGRLRRELSSLDVALRVNPRLSACAFVATGDHCRITGGPFMGVEGRVLACDDNKAMVALSVTVLGQGTTLTLDANLVERL